MPTGSTRRRKRSRIAQVKAKIKTLFVYKTDVWHFCLGLAAGFMFSVSRWITIALVIIYILYQHFEREHVYESVKDVVTFFSGLLVGLMFVL